VWGDSHAEHLYPALEKVANDLRATGPELLLGISTGCLPVRGIDHMESRGGCERFNQRMFRRAGEDDILGVVIASFWAPYFRERICRPGNGGCEPFPTEEAALLAAKAALSNDVRDLTRRGKRVSILLQVPAYPRSVASYLAERAWFGGQVELAQARADHERSTSGVLSLLRSLSDVPGVSLLDPADVLCPTAMCDFQRNGVSLYRDNNHLTGDAALLLVPMLTRAVRFASGANVSAP
jgi:hypothetical protein